MNNKNLTPKGNNPMQQSRYKVNQDKEYYQVTEYGKRDKGQGHFEYWLTWREKSRETGKIVVRQTLRRYRHFELFRKALVDKWPLFYVPPIPPSGGDLFVSSSVIAQRRFRYFKFFLLQLQLRPFLLNSDEGQVFFFRADDRTLESELAPLRQQALSTERQIESLQDVFDLSVELQRGGASPSPQQQVLASRPAERLENHSDIFYYMEVLRQVQQSLRQLHANFLSQKQPNYAMLFFNYYKQVLSPDLVQNASVFRAAEQKYTISKYHEKINERSFSQSYMIDEWFQVQEDTFTGLLECFGKRQKLEGEISGLREQILRRESVLNEARNGDFQFKYMFKNREREIAKLQAEIVSMSSTRDQYQQLRDFFVNQFFRFEKELLLLTLIALYKTLLDCNYLDFGAIMEVCHDLKDDMEYGYSIVLEELPATNQSSVGETGSTANKDLDQLKEEAMRALQEYEKKSRALLEGDQSMEESKNDDCRAQATIDSIRREMDELQNEARKIFKQKSLAKDELMQSLMEEFEADPSVERLQKLRDEAERILMHSSQAIERLGGQKSQIRSVVVPFEKPMAKQATPQLNDKNEMLCSVCEKEPAHYASTACGHLSVCEQCRPEERDEAVAEEGFKSACPLCQKEGKFIKIIF